MRPAVRAAAAMAALLVAATGCDGVTPPSAETSVEVDTPKLRQMKAAAGIEDCEPGPGGGELPDLTLACLGGGPAVDLADLKGPVLLNLWYSGCAPCRDEMPALQEFHEGNDLGVSVLGVDVETYPEAAISFAELVGATYPQVADPAGYIFDQPDLLLKPGYPQSILVDADGAVVGKHAGALDTLADIEEFVTASLAGESSP